MGRKFKIGTTLRTAVFAIMVLALHACDSGVKEVAAENNETVTESDKVGITPSDCKRTKVFGAVTVCLPELDGMIECYDSTKIREMLQSINPPTHEVLGCYIQKAIYDSIISGKKPALDNFLIVAGPTEFKAMPLSNSQLDEFTATMSSAFEGGQMGEIIDAESQKHGITASKPRLLEIYTPKENARTLVVLTRWAAGKIMVNQLAFMSLMNVQQQLLMCSYYKIYRGEKTTTAAKMENDALLQKLLARNP